MLIRSQPGVCQDMLHVCTVRINLQGKECSLSTLPTGIRFRQGITGDKPRTRISTRAKLFICAVLCVLFVTLISAYTLSNIQTYSPSPHSATRSTMRNMLMAIKVTDAKVLTPRPDSCETCFAHNFNYVIDNDVMCKLHNDSQEIDLIIFIFTTHQRKQERMAIRQTWLNYTNKNTANIRYSFLLGEVPDENLRKLVEEENKIHNDILKEDFIDAYQNLTYKTIMAFKYASTKCSHAKFVLKTDDDVWVNIPSLLKVVQREKMTLQTAVGGACFHGDSPQRNPDSKWYASFQSYPHDSYPDFCSGTGYVTSNSVAKKIFEISKNVPFFHLEDVYVAICIKKLDYKLHSIPGFNNGRPSFDPCLYKGDNLITSHEVPSEMLINYWNTTCTR